MKNSSPVDGKLSAKTYWLFGLSGSGKSTLANLLYRHLVEKFGAAVRLDGDSVRQGLCSDLGFSPEDRLENLRRAAHVARICNDAYIPVAASFITPTAADRAKVIEIVGRDQLVEIFIDTPIETCEARDPKGLYKRARLGEVRSFTGVSAVFDAPHPSIIRVSTVGRTELASAAELIRQLNSFGS